MRVLLRPENIYALQTLVLIKLIFTKLITKEAYLLISISKGNPCFCANFRQVNIGGH